MFGRITSVSSGGGRCGCGLWAAHRFSLAAPLQSVSRCGGERTERRTGTRICTTHSRQRDHKRPAGRSGAAWSCEGCGDRPGPAPPKNTLICLFTAYESFFFPNMETPGCRLLLAAYFILFCQQGKTLSLVFLSSLDTETP